MGDICLGAYATLEEAQAAQAARPEPAEELGIVEDGEGETPFRVWWARPD
jgi:hypothetical protein